MAKFVQLSSPIVAGAASLRANETWRQLGKKRQHLAATQSFARNDASGSVDCVHLKDILGEIEMPRQLSSEPAIGVLDAAFLPAGIGVAELGGHAADAGQQAMAGELAAVVEGDRTLHLGRQPLEDRHEHRRSFGGTLAGERQPRGALMRERLICPPWLR